MLKKLSNAVQYPGKKSKIAVAIMLAMTMVVSFMTFAFADGEMEAIVTKLLGVILQVFFYIGILLLAWGVGMLVLAFKNEDADSKSRAMMLLVVAIALIGLQPLLKSVLPSLAAPEWT